MLQGEAGFVTARFNAAVVIKSNESFATVNLRGKLVLLVFLALAAGWTAHDWNRKRPAPIRRPVPDELKLPAPVAFPKGERFDRAIAGAVRETNLFNWIRSWPLSALPDLLQRIDSMADAAQRAECLDTLLLHWANAEPAEAASLFLSLDARAGSDWLERFIPIWSELDAAGAVEWVQALPEGEAKSRVLALAGYRWAEIDPEGALAYALSRSDDKMLRIAAGTWCERNPEEAASWVGSLADERERGSLLPFLASIWAQRSPEAAADFVAGLPPGSMQDQAANSVVASWAYSNPSQAAAWLEAFPENSLREEAMASLIGPWASNDIVSAGQWLLNLPEGPSRDAAFAAFSAAIGATHPEMAIAAAERIQDQNLRRQQVNRAVRDWQDAR